MDVRIIVKIIALEIRYNIPSIASVVIYSVKTITVEICANVEFKVSISKTFF